METNRCTDANYTQAGGAAAGLLCGGRAAPASKASARFRPDSGSPRQLHRGRPAERELRNIGICRLLIRRPACELITNYLPGQCCYNLGEYPCRKPWDPDDGDEQKLDRLRDRHPPDPESTRSGTAPSGCSAASTRPRLQSAGFRHFVDMVHRRGMKLIVYASSGYFEKSSPISAWLMRPATQPWWRSTSVTPTVRRPARGGGRISFNIWSASPQDDHGVDGVYDDLGYRQPPDLPKTKHRRSSARV